MPSFGPRTTLAALALSTAAAWATTAHAATYSLAPNEGYFNGWDVSYMPPPPANEPENCFSGPADLPTGTVIHGVLGPLNYRITALTPATPPADNQWQICNWMWGSYLPPGNGDDGAPGSMNYNKGNYDFVADRPFVPGTVMAFQDMDSIESARLTFDDCDGNPVDPAGFDTLRLLPADYTDPVASSQYVGGSPPAWLLTAPVPDANVPNVTVGVVLNAANVCRIHLVGPIRGDSGGVATFFAAPPATTLTVTTTLAGPPAAYSAAVPVTATCTGARGAATITGIPAVTTNTGSAAPGTVSFPNIPVGAVCQVTTGALPAPAAGFTWAGAPPTASVTVGADAAGNAATLALRQSTANLVAAIGPASSSVMVNAPITPVVATCTNAGPDVALDATCAVGTLPAGLTAACTPAGPLTLAAGAAITCTISGTPTQNGRFTLDVTAASTNDAQPADNHASATLTVGTPQVAAVPTLNGWALALLAALLTAAARAVPGRRRR